MALLIDECPGEIMFYVTLCILLFPLVCTGNQYTGNYQIYEVTAFNHHERSSLYSIYVNNHEIIFLNGVTNEAAIPMNVIVQENFTQDFEAYLHFNSIEYTRRRNTSMVIKNITKENNLHFKSDKMSTDLSKTFLNWHKFNEWMDKKIQMHSYLSKIIIGTTYENREIVVLKFSTGKRPSGVFITGAEEGRDWMSPAIILNVLNIILEDKNDLTILTKYYDFYFLPYFNPDGYEYSINQDVLWTKSRKAFFPPRKCSTDKLAVGVNIDRNWFISKSDIKEQECRAVYVGNKALTEEESQALSDFLNDIAVNLMAYINLRGFERVIALPYGYTNLHTNNHHILMEILSSVCNKLYIKYNTTYYYGSTSSLFYNFSGNSPDWIKMNLNIPIVYTVYMKYQDYLLPNASHIVPLSKQFITIMKDTLIFGYNIYGPLFNNQDLCQINFITFTLSIIAHIMNYI